MELDVPIVVSEKADIECRAVASSGTHEVAATFTVIYKRV